MTIHMAEKRGGPPAPQPEGPATRNTNSPSPDAVGASDPSGSTKRQRGDATPGGS